MLFLYERALQREDTSLLHQEKIQQLFEKAIQDDLEERAKGFPRRFFIAQPNNSSSKEITIIKEDTVITQKKDEEYLSLPQEEQQNLILQHILHEKNPLNIQTFDSIFQALLQKEEIELKSAICYYDGSQYVCSTHEPIEDLSAAYTYSTKLIRIGRAPEMTLQAFYTPSSFVHPVYAMWIAISLFVLVCVTVLFLFILHRKDKRKVANASFLLTNDREWEKDSVEISKNFYYCNRKGAVHKTVDGQPIDKALLSGNSNILFHALLQSQEKYLSLQEIDQLIWKEDSANADKRAQLIKQLRKQLSPIKEIRVENEHKKGYRLIICS